MCARVLVYVVLARCCRRILVRPSVPKKTRFDPPGLMTFQGTFWHLLKHAMSRAFGSVFRIRRVTKCA